MDSIGGKGRIAGGVIVAVVLMAGLIVLATGLWASFADHELQSHERQAATAGASPALEADLAFDRNQRNLALSLGGVGAAAGLALIVVTRRRVLRPINAIAAYMATLTRGDFSTPAPYRDRRDELGVLARTVEAYREAASGRQKDRLAHETEIKSYEAQLLARSQDSEQQSAEHAVIIERLGDSLERLAVGDLTVRIAERFPAGFDQLRIDFNASMESLGRVMQSILEATEAVSFGAAELSRAAERLASRTDQQASSVRESAQTLQGLHQEITEMTGSADQVLKVVGGARASAERSNAVMERSVEAMGRIETSSGQIGKISMVIDEIAFQTNLLALNAGIEAARAGESGRGFAVVAAEVRALALRSATAAREINDLVARANREVALGASQVNETGEALKEIVTQVAEVHRVVEEIAASSRAQTMKITEINTAVALIDEITQNNAAMVAEATNASQALAGEAGGLTASISRFHAAAEAPEADPQEAASTVAEIDRLFG